MRPESISELVGVIVLGLIAVGSSIAVKMQAVTHITFFAILASSTGLLSIIFGIRHYLRAQPKFLPIRAEDWKEINTPVQSHEDVRVTILAKDHGKGKNAKVEFLPDGLHAYSSLLYAVNAPNSDIWIYHVSNSFQYPGHVRTCRIKITI